MWNPWGPTYIINSYYNYKLNLCYLSQRLITVKLLKCLSPLFRFFLTGKADYDNNLKLLKKKQAIGNRRQE
jgi:hypothetical protein